MQVRKQQLELDMDAIQSQEAYNFAETQEGWNAEEPPSCP